MVMSHMEDKNMKKALLRGTAEAAEMKDIVWQNIQKELNLNEGKKIDMKAKKKGIPALVKYGSIAAAVAVLLVSNTQYGHAAVDKIRELFAPNKTITQEIEGMGSKDNLSLKEGSSKYIIYIDEERYTMEQVNGKDRILPKAKAANLPAVAMEIELVKDKTPETMAAEIQNQLKGKFSTVQNKGAVKAPVSGILVYANTGIKSDDTIVKYYLVDNGKGGTFVIRQQYFVEAEEGHGARFDNMLKEFKIVSE
jgi:hypothetical protein